MTNISKQRRPKKDASARTSSRQDVSDMFASTPLLDGEDGSEYARFVEQCITAIKPEDAIERIWLQDFVDNTWDIQRLRRIKVVVFKAGQKSAVKTLIGEYSDHARHSPRAREISDYWSEQVPEYVNYVKELLNANGLSEDAIAAEVFRGQFKTLERVDALIASYGYRRDAAMRELERRRDSLAKRAREFAKAEVEEAVFEEVEPKPKRTRKQK